MIGEILAADNAARLEKILTKIAESDDSFERKSADDPINMDLISWYLAECSEGFVAPNYSLLGKFDKYNG